MSERGGQKIHWSFWVVGTVGIVFNLLGCLNYLSQMDPEQVAAMPETYRSIVESRPAWGTAAFATAVFAGLLGCILLLLRQRSAIYVLDVALVGTVMAQVPYLGLANFPMSAWVGWGSQLFVAAFLVWYAWRSDKKGCFKKS